MATSVIMPRFGQSVESCIITSWAKKVGDPVRAGEILFSYETDKACFDEEAKADGTLLAVFFQEQDDVPCLTEIAVIGDPGEDISGFGPGNKGDSDGAAQPGTAPESSAQAPLPQAPSSQDCPGASAPEGNGTVFASPRARAAAERLRVDLSAVVPTGPHGRVIERDVLSAPAGRFTAAAFSGERPAMAAAAEGTGIGGRVSVNDLNSININKGSAAQPAVTGEAPVPAQAPSETGPGWRDEKASRLRVRIARSMHDSLMTMAQLTHHASFDATAITAYRRALKASGSEKLSAITYNDILLFAVSRVLKRYPFLNAHWLDESDTIRYFDHVHLGMAVDTPRGLLVPTIFNADTLSLAEISAEAKRLSSMAQTGAVSPEYLNGATFTVSNLGAFGVEMFTPVINPPQTGILGVDCIVDRIRLQDGNITVYPAMGISLTYDHRAMDGAPASRFLKDLKESLEQFTVLLAE